MEKQQEKYMELQLLSQQIRNIQKQLQVIENQMIELVLTKHSLDELGNVKINSSTLAPIANGIFIESNIKNTDELIVNVGGNVAVKKTREEVKGMIDNQIDEIKKVQNELLINLQKTAVEAQNLEKELQNV